MERKEFTTVQIQNIDAVTLLAKLEILTTEIKKLQSNPEAPSEKLVTRFEVATLLSVSLVTVHNWTKAGILKAYRMGNKVRYKESEVYEALKLVTHKEKI